MISDPIGDMATRLRNALSVEALYVDVPSSKFKAEVAAGLQREGFIWDFESVTNSDSGRTVLRLNLKYGPAGERVLRSIRRVSRPGRRVYFSNTDTPKVLGGLGVMLMSTNLGVLSSREAAEKRVGGEALLEVW